MQILSITDATWDNCVLQFPARIAPWSMPTQMPKFDYAGLTDTGRKRLANEDACHCEPLMGLFVVCDGIGGQPSGEAASQIICHSFGHLVRRRLRSLSALESRSRQK